MSKHTPGPWKWSNEYQSRKGDDTFSLIGACGYGILSCDGVSNSPQHCNPRDASLIASAPDLLEACKQAQAGTGDWRAALDDAIAKAEGGAK